MALMTNNKQQMKDEIIYTDDYALIVSDEEIKEGDWVVDKHDVVYKQETDKIFPKFNGAKKIIAHRPLTDTPVLEGVPLLPEFTQENDVEEVSNTLFRDKIDNLEEIHSDYILGFQEGHRKAKETYKYTEEDLRNAFLEGNKYPQESKLLPDFYLGNFYNRFIESLQQPKRPKSILLEKIENNICIGQYFFD
jgi:hypothetical protein